MGGEGYGHEGNLECVSDFGDDGAFRKEPEEFFADCERKRGDEDAECYHLETCFK